MEHDGFYSLQKGQPCDKLISWMNPTHPYFCDPF